MAGIRVQNWFGDLISHPAVVTEAHSVEDIVRVLKDPVRFPSPVRAVGSNHSPSECAMAEGGTVLKMKMNRVVNAGPDTITVEAGALYIDVAKELERRNRQFHVNTEIGCLTAGSAACAGSKDASMPGEYGQIGSYVTAVKMVLPNGELKSVGEAEDPELMRKVRSSHGTFGVVYEVTFRTRPLAPMRVYHQTFDLEEFTGSISELKRRNASMMMYLFPFTNKVTIEFREYNPEAKGSPNRRVWRVRNYYWADAGPFAASVVDRFVRPASLRSWSVDQLNALWRFILEHRIKSEHTIGPDEMIRYPQIGNRSRYTFSMFAFAESDYPRVLRDYYEFCRDYYRRKTYRVNLLNVGYTIAQDQQALLSYSFNGPVMSIDPVSTGNPGWKEFLAEYNRFCSDNNGMPLLNQTWGLTREIVEKAFGERLAIMADARRQFDPEARLLNDYFRMVFGETAAAPARSGSAVG